MNCDQDALIFVVEYFEMLEHDRASISNVYDLGARMVLMVKEGQPQRYSNDFHRVIPPGKRKIIQCNGEVIDGRLFVHVYSSLERPSGTDFVDEAMSCTLRDASILINYHTIHVLPFYAKLAQLPPPPPPAPKPAPKPVEKPKPPPPTEVTDLRSFDTRLSVFVRNLPFAVPASEFVSVLERFGRVVKFAQTKGKLVAQFETRAARNEATHAEEFEWNGRTPRIGGMPPDFQWEREREAAPPAYQDRGRRGRR